MLPADPKKEKAAIEEIIPPSPLWIDFVLRLGLIWARSFRYGRENEVHTIELVKKFKSPALQLVMVYNCLVSLGEIQKIEDLDPVIKEELRAEALDWVPGQSNAVTNNVARSIWALNHLIEKYLIPREL